MMTASNSRRKNTGILTLDVGIGLVVISIVWLIIAMGAIEKTHEVYAEHAKQRLEYVIDQAHRYYMDQVTFVGNLATDINNYPDNINTLVLSNYIPECINANALQNLCIDMTVMPWGNGTGEPIILSRYLDASGYPTLSVTFDISTELDDKRRNYLRAALGQIPTYLESAAGIVTYNIPRPAEAVSYSNLVARDGSTEMTDVTWDYGGETYLDNVQDMSLTDLDDRTVITGLMKNGSVEILDATGVDLTKPSCPDGYTPEIQVHVAGIGGSGNYSEVGNFDAWYVDKDASTWTLLIRFSGYLEGDTQRRWHNVGTVTFQTWCDFA